MCLTDSFFAAQVKTAHATAGSAPTAGIVNLTDNLPDLSYSSFCGFTQSATSTARCGNNVVAGFNN